VCAKRLEYAKCLTRYPDFKRYYEGKNDANNTTNSSSPHRLDDPALFALPSNQSLEQRRLDVTTAATRHEKKLQEAMIPRVSRGFYALQLVHWLDYFRVGYNLKIVRYEHFNQNQPQVFREILEFIEVDLAAWQLEEEVFQQDLSPIAKKVGGSPGDLHPTVRAYLQLLYRPYNDELADLLGEDWWVCGEMSRGGGRGQKARDFHTENGWSKVQSSALLICENHSSGARGSIEWWRS